MLEKSRELSQFASSLQVDNTTGNISISTSTNLNVGIGTTNPQYKFHVVGNTNITGILTASSFYLNGSELVDATLQIWQGDTDVYRLTGSVGVGTSVFSGETFHVIGNSILDGNVDISGNITSSNITSSGNIISSGNITGSRFISTITSGTAPFTINSTTQVNNLNVQYHGGKLAPSGDIVGNTDTQTLSNKSLIDSLSFFINDTDNTKRLRFELDDITSGQTRILRIPDINNATIVVTGASNIITSDMIADLEIVNVDVSESAAIEYSKLDLNNSIVNSDIVNGTIENSKLSNSTISGISLGTDLNTLTFGTFLDGGSYNGSSAINVSVAATHTNITGNNIVSRDINGDFSATNITASSFIIDSGTSNQFLKADGSIDSNEYVNIGKSIAMAIVFG